MEAGSGKHEWQHEYDKKLLQAAEIITDSRESTYDYTYFLKQAFKAVCIQSELRKVAHEERYAEMYSDLLRFVEECEEAQDLLRKKYREKDDQK